MAEIENEIDVEVEANLSQMWRLKLKQDNKNNIQWDSNITQTDLDLSLRLGQMDKQNRWFYIKNK